MSSPKSTKPDIITYGDHELITPDTRHLRTTLRPAAVDEPDPVARAEAARRKVKERGLSRETKQELFLAAHDVKGDSGTFGYPEVVPAADSLCRLLEHTPDLSRIPLAIVDQHVDAVRAIVREHDRDDIGSIAAALTGKLRTVTDEFLVRENQDRPDVLKTIQSPSIAPIESF